MTNFDFLKQTDKNLFEIIDEAERLYRGEFFDQCMVQTRKFGENICKNVLGDRCTTEVTFDSMLATLKDKTSGSVEEKEFIEDLYFLKKHGNDSAHSWAVKKDGMEALECLQRAFETAINYTVYFQNGSKSILDKRYDIDLLITGKKSTKSLSQKYEEEKLRTNSAAKKSNNKKPSKNTKQYCSVKSKPTNKSNKGFYIISGISLLISLIILLVMVLI